MQMMSITELTRLRRNELYALLKQTIDALSDYPEGAPERHTVLMNMGNIRWAIARPRRGLAP